MRLALIHTKTGAILNEQEQGEFLSQIKKTLEAKLSLLNQRGHVLELLESSFNQVVEEYKAKESPLV